MILLFFIDSGVGSWQPLAPGFLSSVTRLIHRFNQKQKPPFCRVPRVLLDLFRKFVLLCAGRVGHLLNLTSLGSEISRERAAAKVLPWNIAHTLGSAV